MKPQIEILENVTAMLKRTPALTFTYVKQEMVRFGNRFRKRLRKERMSGRPGINAPKLSKGKNLSAWTKGDSIQNLTTTARITRILVAHEQGAKINADGGGYLYIHGKNRQIVARVKSVTIPARLGFRSMWREMVPDEKARIQNAMNRAVKVASERNVQQIIKNI